MQRNRDEPMVILSPQPGLDAPIVATAWQVQLKADDASDKHEGVAAVIQGQSGATYHPEPNGQELVVGYAPVAGPGWGLIVEVASQALQGQLFPT